MRKRTSKLTSLELRYHIAQSYRITQGLLEELVALAKHGAAPDLQRVGMVLSELMFTMAPLMNHAGLPATWTPSLHYFASEQEERDDAFVDDDTSSTERK